MSTTVIYLLTQSQRAAEAPAPEPRPTKAVRCTELRTRFLGRGVAARAIRDLEVAGGHFHWRHVIDGLVRDAYFGVEISGPAARVDAVLTALAG